MTRNRKSLEEQLAEVQAKQDRVKARLAELELRRKARDRHMRAQGERVFLRLMLQRMEEDSVFAEATRRHVEQVTLLPKDKEAIDWLIDETIALSPVT